jgi:hypothetical protein
MAAFKRCLRIFWRAVGGPWFVVPVLVAGVLAWPNRLFDPAATIPVRYVVPLVPIILWLLVGLFVVAMKLERVQSRQRAFDVLSDYLWSGNTEIFNREVKSDEELERWRTDWETWQQRVERHIAANFGRAERDAFRNLVLMPAVDIMGSYNSLHNRHRTMLMQQLSKIRSITAAAPRKARP